jgi:SAM-dependent methyltransferase
VLARDKGLTCQMAVLGRNTFNMDSPEEFRPISVTYDGSQLGRLSFAIRRVVDLQVRTIYDFLRHTVPLMEGAVLDVGCGESPYVHLLTGTAFYTGVDIADADKFGMIGCDGTFGFDGETLPFPDASFDHVICTEVLEHARDPTALVAEMHRVMKGGGTLVATIPFSARVHYEPHDYQRFTFWGLKCLFAGFKDVTIATRGTDLVSITAKLVVVAVRLARPKSEASLLWRVPVFLILAPVLGVAMIIAHVALRFDFGSKTDPLGYSIICVK